MHGIHNNMHTEPCAAQYLGHRALRGEPPGGWRKLKYVHSKLQVICSSPSEISRVRVRSKSILVHVHSFVCHLRMQPAPGACHPSVRMRVVRSAPAGAASRASAAYASPLFACWAAASEPCNGAPSHRCSSNFISSCAVRSAPAGP